MIATLRDMVLAFSSLHDGSCNEWNRGHGTARFETGGECKKGKGAVADGVRR